MSNNKMNIYSSICGALFMIYRWMTMAMTILEQNERHIVIETKL